MTNILDDSFVINLRGKEKLVEEFGSIQTVRFITENRESKTTTCIDCDAKSLAFQLEALNLDDPDQDIVGAMKKIKEAVLFILWNTDWPVGD